MSLPEITDIVGGYVFEWGEEMVTVEVCRLRSDSKAGVHGEILVQTTAPGYAPHLHMAQFNFSATRSRKDLAKTLAESYNSVNWGQMLEQVCVHTLDRFRKGEPVKEIWTCEDVQAPEYLLHPIIIKNYPSIIFGHRSTAKSTLAIILTQIMMRSWTDNPLRLVPQPREVRCLYLDWETDENTIRWQLRMLQTGMEFPALMLNYRQCALPLYMDVEQIRRHIIETHSEMVVIDSLGPATGGELKETGPALGFFSALRQLKTTSLILAHTSKDRETKVKSVFGSVFFENQARSIWEITKEQEMDADEISVGLRHHKPPPFAKLHKPLGFKLVFDEQKSSMQIMYADPRNIPEFIDKLGAQQRVLHLLKGGPLTPKEIAEELGLTNTHARNVVFELSKKNKITKINEKEYGLVLNEVY